jgi:hypothetical protein
MFDWEGRMLSHMENEKARTVLASLDDLLDDETKIIIKDLTKTQLGAIQYMHKKFAEDLKAGRIKFRSVRDYEVLMDMHDRVMSRLNTSDLMTEALKEIEAEMKARK